MLEIITGDVSLDLAPDTSITLVFENPIFDSGGIPTPYSLTYNLPRTPKNLAALGNPHRVASTVDFVAQMPITIMFGGLEIARGMQTIESVSRDAIEVSFNTVIMPDTSKLRLPNLPLDRIDFGNALLRTRIDPDTGKVIERWDTSDTEAQYLAQMTAQTTKTAPDFVAATLAVKGEVLMAPEDGVERPFSYNNQRSMRINNYYNGYGRTKIIPAIRVGYILKRALPQLSGAFDDGDMARLMVVCSYHPKYQTDTDGRVYDLDAATKAVSVKLADFLPDIAFDEFLCEILKLPCASMFVVNGNFRIESNSTILQRTDAINWDGKIIGTPTINCVLGERYVIGYADADDEPTLDPATEIRSIRTVEYLAHELPIGAPAFGDRTTRVEITGQIYERGVNDVLSTPQLTHYDLSLVADTPFSPPSDNDQQRNEFDMTFNGSPARMVLATNIQGDSKMIPSFDSGNSHHQRIFCPEIEVDAEKHKRPSKLIVGLWQGMQKSISTWVATPFDYPSISRYNFAANGTRIGNTSLSWDGADGLLTRYHAPYRGWIERDKQSLKADILLDNLDLHNLDLRRKIHVAGRNFLIKELSVNLTIFAIEPAEMELVEA